MFILWLEIIKKGSYMVFFWYLENFVVYCIRIIFFIRFYIFNFFVGIIGYVVYGKLIVVKVLFGV